MAPPLSSCSTGRRASIHAAGAPARFTAYGRAFARLPRGTAVFTCFGIGVAVAARFGRAFRGAIRRWKTAPRRIETDRPPRPRTPHERLGRRARGSRVEPGSSGHRDRPASRRLLSGDVALRTRWGGRAWAASCPWPRMHRDPAAATRRRSRDVADRRAARPRTRPRAGSVHEDDWIRTGTSSPSPDKCLHFGRRPRAGGEPSPRRARRRRFARVHRVGISTQGDDPRALARFADASGRRARPPARPSTAWAAPPSLRDMLHAVARDVPRAISPSR